MSGEPERVPVVIVGAGTVGLAAALFLSQRGVRALAVERRPGLSPHPRALGVGMRTLEIFRDAGLEAEVLAAARPLAASGARISVTTLAAGPRAASRDRGPQLAEVDLARRLSPARGGPCSQDLLDRILLAAARRHGAEVRFDTELIDLDQDPEGVTATVATPPADAGPSTTRTVHASYLIAADGAHGRSRDMAGISASGPGPLGPPLVNIYFRADLRRLVAGREFLLCTVKNDEIEGLLVAVDGSERWLLHLAYDPSRESLQDFTSECCTALVRAAVGVADLPVEVVSVLPWQMTARVADAFRAGRVLLAGDAAHVVPPLGGFGMNVGIADAHNLAWKPALILQRKAGRGLLDTYDAERRDVARFTLDQALRRLAYPQLHWDRSRVADRRTYGIANDYVVQAGYRYVSEAVVGPDPLPSTQDLERALDGAPGSRLPHAWVDLAGARVSTLDLPGGRFALLAGPDGSRWCAAAATVAARLGIDLVSHGVGPDGDAIDPEGRWCGSAGIGDAGAVLVRPDGVVAWRNPGRSATAEQDLEATLRQVLDRPDEGS